MDVCPDGPHRVAGRSRRSDRLEDRGSQLEVTAEAIDRTLAAVAEPHRRRVVDLLRERPRRAGELAAAVGLSPAALSRHLRVLRASGLVEESHPELDARVRVYALRAEPVAGLRAWLDQTESLWVRQMRAFKAHIEQPEA